MPGIDDPIDAVQKQWRNDGDKILESLLAVVGRFEPLTGVVSAIQKHFSGKAQSERINALLAVLSDQIRRHESQIGSIRNRIGSPEFVETLIVAVDQAVRTSDIDKIRRFGAILGYTLRSDGTRRSWDAAAAYVRDVAQLGDDDIRVLRLLHSVYPDLIQSGEAVTDPNYYTKEMPSVRLLIRENGMSPDEFYSTCARLTGFGLALEVQRNDARVSPGEHCFRPTGRAAKLIAMIEKLLSRCPCQETVLVQVWFSSHSSYQ